MNNGKTLISKINAVGSMRQNLKGNKSIDKLDASKLKMVYCSADNDNFTTYVQKKEWIISLNDYLFPPYVECEYVE